MQIINIHYFLFLITIIFVSYSSDILQNYENREIYYIFLFFNLILFFIRKKQVKINLKKDFILIILSLVCRRFYLSFFIIFFSKFVEKKVRIKQLCFIICFFYLLIILINSFGLLEFNNIKYGIRKFENFEVYRNALGFRHPNTAMSMLLPIFFTLYYIYYEKFPKFIIGIIFLIGTIVFYLTFSRTTYLLIFLFIGLILLKDKYVKKLKIIFLNEGFFLVFLTFYLPYYFPRGKLNEIFSWRLWYFSYYIRNSELTYFGNYSIKKLYEELPLDNIYIRVLYEDGVISFIILIFLIYYVMKLLFKYDDMKAIRIFSIILIFGFMEHMSFHYYFNIIIFIISDYIFIENRKKNETT